MTVTVDLNRSDPDQKHHAQLTVGGVLIVHTPSIPGAGYHWDVHRLPRGLRIIDRQPAAFDGDVIGGEHVTAFRFAVDGPLNDSLLMHYRRPWEPNGPLLTADIQLSAR